jgi:hypothetical protein
MPSFDQVHEPIKVALGDQDLKSLYRGTVKVWPLHGPGGAPLVCNPTVAGIAVKNLDATVLEPATLPVTVNWGDGTTEVVAPVGGMLKACHIYATPGVRTIALSDGVVKSQKVNAGVVPPVTQQLVHSFAADGTPEAVYQADAGLPAATSPASWGEKTPFCDGVLRLHTWISSADVQLAMDVSFGGEWWNISGTVLGNINGATAIGKTANPDDYRIFSQAYLPGMHTQDAVKGAWPSGVTWPGTSKELLGNDPAAVMASWIFTDDSPAKLMAVSLADGDPVLQILGLFGDDVAAGTFPTFALPPGFDASMAPTLWVF